MNVAVVPDDVGENNVLPFRLLLLVEAVHHEVHLDHAHDLVLLWRLPKNVQERISRAVLLVVIVSLRFLGAHR